MKLYTKTVCCLIAVILIENSVAQCPYRQLQDSNEVGCPYSRNVAVVNVPSQPQPQPQLPLPIDYSDNSVSAALQRVFSTPNPAYQQITYSPIGEKEALKIINISKAPKKPVQCAAPPQNCLSNKRNYYYRNYDGSCNNLQNPLYGAARTRLTRIVRPSYGDAIYTPTLAKSGGPLPNARLLSLSLYGDTTLPDEARTLAALQWGQLVAHDISELSTLGAPENCCANIQNKLCYPIKLNARDPSATNKNKDCLHLARAISDVDTHCPSSGLDYAEKLTVSTAFLDLSSMYGNSVAQSRKARLFKHGLLKTSTINNRPWLPISQNIDGECGGDDNYQCFNVPDMRNQFVPTIAVIHTIILREHNRVATKLAELNPSWNDERLFQEAKKITIAQYQKITYYDLLPLILGPALAYANKLIYYVQPNEYVDDYDPNINASPFAEYTAAAFRYSHNQIPGWFSLVSSDRVYNTSLRLSNYFGRPEVVNLLSESSNFASLLRGMTTQRQKLPDANIDREIKYYFDRKPNQEFGGDLKAIDIQRARDFGVASYNDLRQECGLPRAYDWSGFANEISAEKIKKLSTIYESPEDVELSVGGSLESHTNGANLGPTFQCIVIRQFLKLRKGDRFFFEHGEEYQSGLTREQLAEIRKASVSALFCNNADNLNLIQPNAFVFPNAKNLLDCCQKIPQIDLTKWKQY